MDDVEAALDVVNAFRDRPAGTLKLNVPASASRLVLPPIVTPFLKAYPDIKLEVIVEDGSSTCWRPGATPASAMTSGWSRT